MEKKNLEMKITIKKGNSYNFTFPNGFRNGTLSFLTAVSKFPILVEFILLYRTDIPYGWLKSL